MRKQIISLIMVSLVPGSLLAVLLQSSEKKETRADSDKAILEALLRDDLFDPKDCRRVSVEVELRSVWGESEKVNREGWLPATPSGARRIYFTDGESIPAPPDKEITSVDFIAACRSRYEGGPAKDNGSPLPGRRRSLGLSVESDLAIAAWLYRLAEPELAAKALAKARQGEGDPRQLLRADLAWSAFAAMVHAYMVRADAEALAHGERLLKRYGDVTDKDFAQIKASVDDQAKTIVADLRRRQKKGTFGKQPAPKWPDGFDKWDSRKKTAFLIDALDEVDVRQRGQPGGVDLASDRRVRALIALGEGAVPDLIDTVEKDERLTRSVHFWRDFARTRTVLGVREAALTAVMSITRVRFFETRITGDNFTGRGEEGVKKMAARLRTYWQANGNLSQDERMMKVLTDPKSTPEAAQEAAYNLAHWNEKRTMGTTILTDSKESPSDSPKPLKFDKLVIAEAMLTALDRDLKSLDAGKKDATYQYTYTYRRQVIEESYLNALAALGKKQIANELARRSKAAADVSGRRRYSVAAYRLGNPEPMHALAEDVRAGRIVLPARGGPSIRGHMPADAEELQAIIATLASAGSRDANLALVALAEPKHPYHAMVTEQVLSARPGGFQQNPWFDRHFCLPILRRALDDTTPTEGRFKIEGDNYSFQGDGASLILPVPKFLKDPNTRRTDATVRICDKAAEKLGELVLGLPFYHPLLKDPDKRLAEIKNTFDRFARQYRERNLWTVNISLGFQHVLPVYVPELPRLERGATPEDVKTAEAIFHLDGKGIPVALVLPALGELKDGGAQAGEGPRQVVIVQAEAAADGAVTYGVIGKNFMRAVSQKNVHDVKPLAQALKGQ